MFRMLAERDPVAMNRQRLDHMAYLAKYGGQDMGAWDDVDVTDLFDRHDAMNRLIARENEANKTG